MVDSAYLSVYLDFGVYLREVIKHFLYKNNKQTNKQTKQNKTTTTNKQKQKQQPQKTSAYFWSMFK